MYAVTYDANWGTEVDSWTGKYGATIPNKSTSRSGYDFAWWTWGTTVPADDLTVTAQWTPRNDTPYTVKHMQENANDTGYTLFESGTWYGTTEDYTNVVAKTYSGFKAWVFQNAIISGSGSTVVEVYYDREIYEIAFDTSTWTHVNTISAKYWATVSRPNNPELSWYTFIDWNPGFPSIMPLGGTGLTAIWVANSDTPYVVNHWYLDVNGNRDDWNKEVENLTGTTDSEITPDFVSKDGFNDPANKVTKKIKWD